MRILEARQMLEEQGGRDVRMGDIAEVAGISRQVVYLSLITHIAPFEDRLKGAT